MAAISLFWYTNMAAVTSDENDLYKISMMPTGLTPQKRLLSHPSEKLIRRGGVDIYKWNGPNSEVSMISTAQTAKLFIELFLYTTGNRTTEPTIRAEF